MEIMKAIEARRSIRRFTRTPLPREAVASMLEAARLSPTGVNRQPLQFAAVTGAETCAALFPHTAWAGKIPDGSAGPDEHTQPTGYIVILIDKWIAQQADTDAGAAAMSIMLAAQGHGIASCWLGSVKRAEVLRLLGLDSERFAIHTVVALGYPAMASRAVDMQGDNTDYYLEGPDSLCVPKRAREDIFHWFE